MKNSKIIVLAVLLSTFAGCKQNQKGTVSSAEKSEEFEVGGLGDGYVVCANALTQKQIEHLQSLQESPSGTSMETIAKIHRIAGRASSQDACEQSPDDSGLNLSAGAEAAKGALKCAESGCQFTSLASKIPKAWNALVTKFKIVTMGENEKDSLKIMWKTIGPDAAGEFKKWRFRKKAADEFEFVYSDGSVSPKIFTDSEARAKSSLQRWAVFASELDPANELPSYMQNSDQLLFRANSWAFNSGGWRLHFKNSNFIASISKSEDVPVEIWSRFPNNPESALKKLIESKLAVQDPRRPHFLHVATNDWPAAREILMKNL